MSIEWMNSIKYFGAILDSSSIFDEHIDFLEDKASEKLGAICWLDECQNLFECTNTTTAWFYHTLTNFLRS